MNAPERTAAQNAIRGLLTQTPAPPDEIDRLTQEIQRKAKRIKELEDFLRTVNKRLEDGTASDDTVWFGPCTTLFEAIEGVLDDPRARGEQPLPLEIPA